MYPVTSSGTPFANANSRGGSTIPKRVQQKSSSPPPSSFASSAKTIKTIASSSSPLSLPPPPMPLPFGVPVAHSALPYHYAGGMPMMVAGGGGGPVYGASPAAMAGGYCWNSQQQTAAGHHHQYHHSNTNCNGSGGGGKALTYMQQQQGQQQHSSVVAMKSIASHFGPSSASASVSKGAPPRGVGAAVAVGATPMQLMRTPGTVGASGASASANAKTHAAVCGSSSVRGASAAAQTPLTTGVIPSCSTVTTTVATHHPHNHQHSVVKVLDMNDGDDEEVKITNSAAAPQSSANNNPTPPPPPAAAAAAALIPQSNVIGTTVHIRAPTGMHLGRELATASHDELVQILVELSTLNPQAKSFIASKAALFSLRGGGGGGANNGNGNATAMPSTFLAATPDRYCGVGDDDAQNCVEATRAAEEAEEEAPTTADADLIAAVTRTPYASAYGNSARRILRMMGGGVPAATASASTTVAASAAATPVAAAADGPLFLHSPASNIAAASSSCAHSPSCATAVAYTSASASAAAGFTAETRPFATIPEQLSTYHPTPTTLHPCLRTYGNCRMPSSCIFKHLPCNICIPWLRGECTQRSLCPLVHRFPVNCSEQVQLVCRLYRGEADRCDPSTRAEICSGHRAGAGAGDEGVSAVACHGSSAANVAPTAAIATATATAINSYDVSMVAMAGGNSTDTSSYPLHAPLRQRSPSVANAHRSQRNAGCGAVGVACVASLECSPIEKVRSNSDDDEDEDGEKENTQYYHHQADAAGCVARALEMD